MSVLVRDVSDFMTSEERALPLEEGIRRYNARLAGIYKSEEAIGGLPINMEGFCLFDPEHRSSKPLCLAYKAAQLADPKKANSFLAALRHATVLDCRPTTHMEEILKVVRASDIAEADFTAHYQDGSAEEALNKDHALAKNLGIRSLPSYLIQCGDKAILMQSFQYQDFVDVILNIG